MKKAAKVAVLLLFAGNVAFAQTAPQPINLSEALEMAKAHHPGLESARLNEQFHAQMQGTWNALEKTDISVELGQFNSRAFDNKIGVSQQFQFPKVYKTQKQLLSEQVLVAQAQSGITERELKTTLSQLFYDYLWLESKAQLLQQADSIYQVFESKAQLRFQRGETNLLEKTTAQMQRQQILNQLEMLRQDGKIMLQQFNFLLGSTEERVPKLEQNLLPRPVSGENASFDLLPQFQYQQHQLNVAKYMVATEKAKLLPGLTVGLNSQSIIGYQLVGNEERYYNGWNRFTFLNAGIAVPLFSKAQHARIMAYETQVLQQQKELDWLGQRTAAQRNSARQQVLKYWDSLQYYLEKALPGAKTIVSTASWQFSAGEINYLEWVMLINQSFEIQGQFLDEQNHYNQAVLHFQTFIQE